MEDSIFTKIIKGEIPCHRVYDDEKTLAFMTIHPAQPGHVLVIPKKQVQFLWDLPDEDYQAVMATAKKVAQRVREVLRPPYVGEMVVGTDVPHAHVHIIPFESSDQLLKKPDTSIEPDHSALAAMAEKLKF